MSAKTEPKWMPSEWHVSVAVYSHCNDGLIGEDDPLRVLIRRTAIKAQLAVLGSEYLGPLCSCHRIIRNGVEVLVSPCEIHELLSALRAELAETERGD